MTETTTLPFHSELESALHSNPSRIIVEGGHKGHFSTKASDPDTLIVGVDPQVPKDRFRSSNVLDVRDTLSGLYDHLAHKADTILMVAPSPLDCLEMVTEAEDLLKNTGQIIVILDSTSNRKEYSKQALVDIQKNYEGTDYQVRSKRIEEESNLPGILKKLTNLKITPQSEINLDNSTVVVIKKKENIGY